MPELPEVQTIADDLNKKVLGRKITGVWLDWPKLINLLENRKGVLRLIKKPALKDFEKAIKGRKIIKAHRKAKNILIDLSGGFMMLIHQKMTGHLLVGKWKIIGGKPVAVEPKSIAGDPYNRFVHVIFYLNDGNMLALSDVRKFAKIILGKKEDLENLPELKELGPEPLDKNFNFEKFKAVIQPSSKRTLRQAQGKKIKQVLMDPKVISGIGNIYSDDILWLARINPFTPANNISDAGLKDLFKAIGTVLKKAIRLRGTSISDFRDTAGKKGHYNEVRLVYQRKGERCPRKDGGIIVKKKIGGRSTCFCPVCQSL